MDSPLLQTQHDSAGSISWLQPAPWHHKEFLRDWPQQSNESSLSWKASSWSHHLLGKSHSQELLLGLWITLVCRQQAPADCDNFAPCEPMAIRSMRFRILLGAVAPGVKDAMTCFPSSLLCLVLLGWLLLLFFLLRAVLLVLLGWLLLLVLLGWLFLDGCCTVQCSGLNVSI